MSKLKKIITSLVIGVMAVSGGAAAYQAVWAAENSTAIVLSPMSEKMVLTPGEKYQGALKISNPNTSTDDLQYSVSVESFSQTKDGDSKDDYGNVDTRTVTAYNQIMEWVTLGKESGTVKPNETDTLAYTIDVPMDAPAGGQYATIVITDETNHYADAGNININSVPRVASIIYAEVTGETRNTGEIVENNVPSFLLNNMLETTSVVKNTGNVHTNASYILQVWPLGSDEEICTNEEEPAKSLVMPETERYHMESCQLPSVGIFKTKQTVKIFGEESIVEKMVIVCPLWLLFIILFVIAALIIWIVMRVKHHSKNSKAKKSGKSEKQKDSAKEDTE